MNNSIDFLSSQLHSSLDKPNIEGCGKKSASHLVRLSPHFTCCCCSVKSGCCPTWPWERSWCYCLQHRLQFYCLHSHLSFAIRAFGGVHCFRIETVAIVAINRQPRRCYPSQCVAFSTSIASCLYLRLGAIPPCPLLPCFSSTLRTFHLRDQTGSLAYINQISPVNRMIGFSNKENLPLMRIAALCTFRLSLNFLAIFLFYGVSFD